MPHEIRRKTQPMVKNVSKSDNWNEEWNIDLYQRCTDCARNLLYMLPIMRNLHRTTNKHLRVRGLVIILGRRLWYKGGNLQLRQFFDTAHRKKTKHIHNASVLKPRRAELAYTHLFLFFAKLFSKYRSKRKSAINWSLLP